MFIPNCNFEGKTFLSLFYEASIESEVLVTQSCPAPCDPTDCCPSDSLSTGFPRQGCWRGQPLSSSGDLLDAEVESGSPALQADSSPPEPARRPALLSY